MLGEDATDREHEILGAIPYQPNEAVLHTDTRLLPRRKRAWASWNYHLLAEPTGMTTVTYHMNRLQALTADREFCVTLNRGEAIDPGKVLRRFSYAHPVFTRRRRSRARRAGTRSAASTARTSPARTGAGASMRTASRARPASPSTSGRACDCTRGRSATGASPCASTPSSTGSRSPARPRGTGRRGLMPRRAATSWRSSPAPVADTAADACSRTLARLQPRRLLLLLDGGGELRCDRRPRDQHALGRAARLRPRPARRDAWTRRFHVSPFMGMDHRYAVRATAPAETLSMHIESPPRTASSRSTPL